MEVPKLDMVSCIARYTRQSLLDFTRLQMLHVNMDAIFAQDTGDSVVDHDEEVLEE